MTEENEKFLRDVRQVLDDQNSALDGATLSRLNRSRQQALQKKSRPKSRLLGWTLVPAAGAALMVLLLRQPTSVGPPAGDEISDLQILTSEETLEFFQEDMAFYEWIDEILAAENADHHDGSGAVSADRLVSSGSSGSRAESTTGAGSETGWRTSRVSRFI